MNIDDYGFYFEEQGRSGEEGPIDPSQEYFQGAHAGDAVVRETGQNTLDNPGTDAVGPIRMEFELATMLTEDIPGIQGLRNHLDATASQTSGQQGHERMQKAAELAWQKEITVLRISDYNTTGLIGSESLNSRSSPLSRLTRGKGGSDDDERGGSFGIGSAVGPMASQMSTVIYTSLPEGSDDTVMAGYARLATHKLDDKSYRAEGYFTLLDCDDFRYPRPAPAIGPFSARTQPGTDIYILGYRMAENDPKLESLREALIENFMVAIDREKLVVEGLTKGHNWQLNAETLEGFAKSKSKLHAFYLALKDPEPSVKTLPHLGKVQLYVNIDDRLDKKLDTITMRAPLMKIDTFKHHSISAKYAAVLICEEAHGNKYLRSLEPPQHHIWDAARDPLHGRKVVNSLKAFVRDALKERVSEEIGDVVEIDGLARFLPTEAIGEDSSGEPAIPTSKAGAEGTSDESSSVVGDPADIQPTIIQPGRKVPIKVHRPAISKEGDEAVRRGGSRGGSGTRKSLGGKLQGSGIEGNGTSRILGKDLRFRSWSASANGEKAAVISVAITASNNEVGDLELVALGTGGEPEKDFELGISKAVLHGPDGKIEVTCSGNTLKNISLLKDQKTRIDLYVPAGERYRLEAV